MDHNPNSGSGSGSAGGGGLATILLEVRGREDGGQVVARMSGVVDPESTEQFGIQLGLLAESAYSVIVLDLSDVVFRSAVAVLVVLDIRARVERAGNRMDLCCHRDAQSAVVLRLLDVPLLEYPSLVRAEPA